MSYTSTGEVIALTDIELVGANGMPKRQIVIKLENDRFDTIQPFTLLKDKAENCPAQVGQTVLVSWDYKGREYNGRYYADAVAWKIEVQGQSGSVQQQQPVPYSDNELDSDSVPF